MKVKICGITNTGDALFAERKGADAIGVVVSSESPRCMTVAGAHEIFSVLGPFTASVVVTHTDSKELLEEIAFINPSAIQLSADVERPQDFCGKLIRVVGEEGKVREDCDAVIIDSSCGRGIRFDRDHAQRIMELSKRPVILAGGLDPSNVAEAISLRPYAVDVCTGVEVSPGVKDREKVAGFLRAAGKISI